MAINPVWTGAFDTADTSQYFQVLTPTQGRRIGFGTNPHLSGTHACRMELRRGDTANDNNYYPNAASSDGKNRNQFRGINYGNHYFNEGENRYFRFGLYIDPSTTIGASFSNPWRALIAFPSVEDGAFSPLKVMLMREKGGGASPSGIDALCVAGDLGGQTQWDITQWALRNPAKGIWHHFVFHWIFSGDRNKGLVEFWYRNDSEPLLVKKPFADGSTTKHMKTLSAVGHRANLRVGLYRNPSFTTTDVIYYDNIYMANSFADITQ